VSRRSTGGRSRFRRRTGGGRSTSRGSRHPRPSPSPRGAAGADLVIYALDTLSGGTNISDPRAANGEATQTPGSRAGDLPEEEREPSSRERQRAIPMVPGEGGGPAQAYPPTGPTRQARTKPVSVFEILHPANVRRHLVLIGPLSDPSFGRFVR